MQTDDKIQYMTNEESYTQRRMLFKDIWETAMNIDEKDDIMNKPKVIKTLRLDEVDKCVVGKTKKQRIKNLRHVCNRILDFCDKQDADDVFYEQAELAADQEPVKAIHKIDPKNPKKKSNRGKKKMKKANSMLVSQKVAKPMDTTISERKTAAKAKPLSSPPVIEKWALKSRGKVKAKPSPVKKALAPPEDVSASYDSDIDGSQSPFLIRAKKPVKNKHSRRKKPSESAVQAIGMMKAKTGRIPRASPKGTNLAKPIPQLAKVITN